MDSKTSAQNDENPKDGQQSPISPITSSKGECPDITDLSEKEQKNPVSWKWVMRELIRLRSVSDKYETLKEEHAELDKQFEVYKAKNAVNTTNDIVVSVMLAIGPAMLGLIPAVNDSNADFNPAWAFGIIGAIMLIAAIIIKVSQTKRS